MKNIIKLYEYIGYKAKYLIKVFNNKRTKLMIK